MNAYLKMAVGAVLCGVGFVVAMSGQRQIVAGFKDCDDCEEELPEAAVTEEIDLTKLETE
jgi:hypothetical protein